LSLQDQYSQNVAKQAQKIIAESYDFIEREQNEMLSKMFGYLHESVSDITKDMENSKNACRAAATATQEATEKLYKFQTWKDFLYYAAPAAVLLNLIFRAVQQFFL
jgi:GTPase involved in cell partitioning and DNA repair